MEYLSTIFVLLIFSCYCTAVPLAKRVKILERDIRERLFIITSDLIDLENRLDDMNSTVHQNIGGLSPSDIASSIKAVEDKLNQFIQIQSANSVVMSRAISHEKEFHPKYTAFFLETIQFIDGFVPLLLQMDTTIEFNKAKIQECHTQVNEFKTNMKAELEAVRNDTKLLDEKITDMFGIPGQLQCPQNWFKNWDTCYLFDKLKKLSWFRASIVCHDLGGKLTEPDTKAKMQYLLGTIDVADVWIGATDDEQEGKWVWASSQKPVSYVIWQTGQPNNLFENQNCMEIGMSKLNDEDCSEENTYICEKPAFK